VLHRAFENYTKRRFEFVDRLRGQEVQVGWGLTFYAFDQLGGAWNVKLKGLGRARLHRQRKNSQIRAAPWKSGASASAPRKASKISAGVSPVVAFCVPAEFFRSLFSRAAQSKIKSRRVVPEGLAMLCAATNINCGIIGALPPLLQCSCRLPEDC
jgi:hypothetical protein